MKKVTVKSLLALLLALVCLSAAFAEELELDGGAVADDILLPEAADGIELPGDGALEAPEIEAAFALPEASGDEARPAANSGDVEINADNFPDDVFRQYVSEAYDEDEDGWLSDSEIAEVEDISFLVNNIGCASLEGIEFFYNLRELDCTDCELTQLDVSQNEALVELTCVGNGLKRLTLGYLPNLRMLCAEGNSLSSIGIGQCPILLDAVENRSFRIDDGEAIWEDDEGGLVISIDATTVLTDRSAVLYPKNQVFAELSATALTLGVKEKYTLKAKVTPSGKASSVRFKSSDTKVAQVGSRSGKITPKKRGTATISVVHGEKVLARCKVTVKKAPGKITLNRTKGWMYVGNTYQLIATLPGGTASAIKWTSSNKKVATVDQTGLITAVKKGTVTITARTFNGKRAKCKVTVK